MGGIYRPIIYYNNIAVFNWWDGKQALYVQKHVEISLTIWNMKHFGYCLDDPGVILIVGKAGYSLFNVIWLGFGWAVEPPWNAAVAEHCDRTPKCEE